MRGARTRHAPGSDTSPTPVRPVSDTTPTPSVWTICSIRAEVAVPDATRNVPAGHSTPAIVTGDVVLDTMSPALSRRLTAVNASFARGSIAYVAGGGGTATAGTGAMSTGSVATSTTSAMRSARTPIWYDNVQPV